MISAMSVLDIIPEIVLDVIPWILLRTPTESVACRYQTIFDFKQFFDFKIILTEKFFRSYPNTCIFEKPSFTVFLFEVLEVFVNQSISGASVKSGVD